jgi:hypothetical protein
MQLSSSSTGTANNNRHSVQAQSPVTKVGSADNTAAVVAIPEPNAQLQKLDSTFQFETPSQIFVMVSEAEEASATLNQLQRLRAKSIITVGSTGAIESPKRIWMSPAVKRYQTVSVDFSSIKGIAKSLKSVQRLLLALPPDENRAELGCSIIKAAKEAGVSFVLFLSIPLPKCKCDVPPTSVFSRYYLVVVCLFFLSI